MDGLLDPSSSCTAIKLVVSGKRLGAICTVDAYHFDCLAEF